MARPEPGAAMIERPDTAKGSEAPGGRTNLRMARPMPRAGQ